MPNIPEGADRIVLPDIEELYVGKVRHTFAPRSGEHPDSELLVATSDRISAFDWVLETPIPGKGKLLNMLTEYWLRFAETLGIPHHMITADIDEIIQRHPEFASSRDILANRSMLVKRGPVFPVEAVVRGNLTGSGWKAYKKKEPVSGIVLEPQFGEHGAYMESQQLDPPLFTASTKENEGHDIPISFQRVCEIVGAKIAEEIREKSIFLFTQAREHAEEKGIILADTKFEWAMIDGVLTLVDEVLTPDSSRFWPAAEFEVGRPQRSFDKQYVRDWLAHESGWDPESSDPPPALPGSIVSGTRAKYIQAYERLAERLFVA